MHWHVTVLTSSNQKRPFQRNFPWTTFPFHFWSFISTPSWNGVKSIGIAIGYPCSTVTNELNGMEWNERREGLIQIASHCFSFSFLGYWFQSLAKGTWMNVVTFVFVSEHQQMTKQTHSNRKKIGTPRTPPSIVKNLYKLDLMFVQAFGFPFERCLMIPNQINYVTTMQWISPEHCAELTASVCTFTSGEFTVNGMKNHVHFHRIKIKRRNRIVIKNSNLSSIRP